MSFSGSSVRRLHPNQGVLDAVSQRLAAHPGTNNKVSPTSHPFQSRAEEGKEERAVPRLQRGLQED